MVRHFLDIHRLDAADLRAILTAERLHRVRRIGLGEKVRQLMEESR